MPPTTLDSLPTEVLQLICRHLCHHCQGRTPVLRILTSPWASSFDELIQSARSRREQAPLASLSRTSRRLHAVAQPVLFHYASDELWTELPFIAYIWAIRTNASLAAAVREIDLGGVRIDEDDDLPNTLDWLLRLPPSSEGASNELLSMASALQFLFTRETSPERLFRDVLPLLLPSLRNLRTLRLADPAVSYLTDLLVGQESVNIQFPTVKTLQVEWKFGSSELPNILHAYRRFPNLCHLEIGNCNGMRLNINNVPMPIPSLFHITIKQGYLTSSILEGIIAMAPNLKAFHYEAGEDQRLAREAIAPSDFTHLLLPRSKTLHTVDVVITQSKTFPRSNFSRRQVLRSFQDFSALETLRINTSDMYERTTRGATASSSSDDSSTDMEDGDDEETIKSWGCRPNSPRLQRLADAIPEGLRRLEVMGGVYVLDCLRLVDRIQVGRFPNLKVVHFGSIYGGSVQDVQGAFVRLGVKCLLGYG